MRAGEYNLQVLYVAAVLKVNERTQFCDFLQFLSQVLYIGKIKVSHKKVPDSFIDDALEKFRVHELEKGKGKAVKDGSNHNISTLGASAGSNGQLNQAHTPGNSIVIGLCRDEEHGHRGSHVSLLQQVPVPYDIFQTLLHKGTC